MLPSLHKASDERKEQRNVSFMYVARGKKSSPRELFKQPLRKQRQKLLYVIRRSLSKDIFCTEYESRRDDREMVCQCQGEI